MIYFDNSATTLVKPPEVAEAVAFAINNFGNAGRSFYSVVLAANRGIYGARAEVARLVGLEEPLNVAFTSSATESLNLVTNGLVKREDSVITTVTEHNSVLRPLYLAGCDLSYIDCDENGVLMYDTVESLIKPRTRFLFCTHGSNVTGNITDAERLRPICAKHGITLVLDVSQTLGSAEVNVSMANVFCFTGHKGLFGPQGTGGIIVNGKPEFDIAKTGGAGVSSFERFQSKDMPDVFEAGTINSHGIYGLQKGVEFINKMGISHIRTKETRLLNMFYDGVKDLERVVIYGDFSTKDRLPIISIGVHGMDSSDFAGILWENYGIATRAGSHCAPLLHRRFATETTGLTRFSFSYFNTEQEIEKGVSAVRNIIRNRP